MTGGSTEAEGRQEHHEHNHDACGDPPKHVVIVPRTVFAGNVTFIRAGRRRLAFEFAPEFIAGLVSTPHRCVKRQTTVSRKYPIRLVGRLGRSPQYTGGSV
jgi:hypothetical protein